jgi:hypothetical protein
MRSLERRVTKLEQDVRHEMVFVTYIGNPEPMSLNVGGRRIDRLPGESWAAFTYRIEAGPLDERSAVGDISGNGVA